MRAFGRTPPKQAGSPTSLGVVEEALTLLQHTPLSVFARYYLSAVPFTVGAVLFWAHMSQSAFAYENLSIGALALAWLFVWLKTGQTLFARDLRCHLLQVPRERWGIRRTVCAAMTQTVLHASSILVYPFAILLFFPLPWVYGTYQNLTVLEEGVQRPFRDTLREAMDACQRWHGQHTLILWLASPGAFVTIAGMILILIPVWSGLGSTGGMDEMVTFGFGMLAVVTLVCLSPTASLVALNLAGLMFLVLSLGEGLTGMDAPLLSTPTALFSTTGFALLAALVFLVMDPVAKAAYVVRCHYGQALRTGEDLRLRLLRAARRAPLALLVTLAWSVLSMSAVAQETDGPEETATVSPAALATAIGEESAKPHFTWRMPRNQREEAEEGWFARHVGRPLQRLRDWLADSTRYLRDYIKAFLDWLFDRNRPAPSGKLLSFRGVARASLVALAVVSALIVVFFLLRTWRKRRDEPPHPTEAVPTVPRLENEDTLADALPESEWVRLAREMVSKGDFRLAARALFLALLSHLAEAGYVTIARHKSNMDYAVELRSRALAEGAGVEATFQDSARVFESVWYGDHEARQEHVNLLWRHQERLRAHAR